MHKFLILNLQVTSSVQKTPSPLKNIKYIKLNSDEKENFVDI